MAAAASPSLPFATYRIRKIPPDYGEPEVKSIITLQDETEEIVGLSVAPDVYSSDQVATLTFNKIPQTIRELGLNDTGEGQFPISRHLERAEQAKFQQDATVTVDSQFSGFTPLNKCAAEDVSTVDVVAVTGLGGKPFMSWQHQSGAMWLRDFLPKHIQNVRVLTYGYDAKLRGSGSHARLRDHSAGFLQDLQHLRTEGDIAHRPLILIGHSYGGLIIKDALIHAAESRGDYERLHISIHSIYFFGVPHRGLNTAAIELMVAEEPTKGLVEELKEGSTALSKLSERFPRAAKNIKLVTCRELLETPTTQNVGGEYKKTGPKEMMVTETAAYLFDINEERVPIHENHSMIAKLSDKPGSGYHRVLRHMKAHAKAAPAIIERRHLKTECSSVLSEVLPLVGFISSVVCLVKQRTRESESIKSSFETQFCFLEAFGQFLVDDELGTILEDPHLSVTYPKTTFETLQNIKFLFSAYKDLIGKFYDPYHAAIQDDTSTDLTRSRIINNPAAAAGKLREEISRNLNINRRLFIEATLTEILKRCRSLTAELKGMMSSAMLYAMLLCQPEGLAALRSGESIRKMGLTRTVRLQHLSQEVQLHGMKIDAVYLTGSLKLLKNESSDDLQVGRFSPNEDLPAIDVLVETRRYPKAPRLESSDEANKPSFHEQQEYVATVKKSLRGLARLLEELSFEAEETSNNMDSIPRTIRTFSCLGCLDDEKSSQMNFLFKLPLGMKSASAKTLRSLANYVETFKPPRKMAPLEQRYALARDLCQTVLNIHECGWIHKSIRSRNVILVPRDQVSSTKYSFEESQAFILHLKGFEFSRLDQEGSSLRADFDPSTNLYRHPKRQGVPTTGFKKEHDIYAVGVVLLEIGFWRTVTSLFKSKIQSARNGNSFMEPEAVQSELMNLAQKHLPMEMGSKYAQAVHKCLSGDFGISEDDEQRTNLALAFRQQVLDLLNAGAHL